MILLRSISPVSDLNKATKYLVVHCIIGVRESSPSNSQKRNNGTLESMVLGHLKISSKILPIKRKPAMSNYSRITKNMRGKLEASIDCTQEQKSSKISELVSNSKKKKKKTVTSLLK